MASCLYWKNNQWNVCKNLGWLLRHASETKRIIVTTANDRAIIETFDHDDNRQFQTEFASWQVLMGWLDRRRCFRHCSILWNGNLLQLREEKS